MKKKNRVKTYNIIPHIVLIFVALACLLPLVLVISASFTSDAEIAKYGYAFIPKNFTLEAYVYIFKKPLQLILSYGVTTLVTVVGTLAGLLITAMLAYGISRKDYPFAKATTLFVYMTMLFAAGLVPWYMMVSNTLNLKDTIFALIVPYLVVPWFVMLMKGYFAEISPSIIEAAKIDGASEFKVFFQIVIPMAKPGLATVGLFIMLMYWNDYYLSLMFIQSSKMVSLQFMLYRMMSNIDFLKSALAAQAGMLSGVQIPAKSIRMAMCVLAAGPMLFVFPFFQKYFVKGIAIGSVKE
ncbi:carbohydrate ABC transporter permease [Robinsoniella sp. KNHs210]|uniref:carbohydrate ABC transporter permease n=1 Tax=Robinsoniella sp. KNHs210 TaxID=1469950 RepID=UPI000489DD83|nr:carbohydrate ABC transporter permease [Robinsoniella sp. KNHs210]